MREFVASRLALEEMLRGSLERWKIIEVKNLDLHKERKSNRKGISEGKIKISLLLT